MRTFELAHQLQRPTIDVVEAAATLGTPGIGPNHELHPELAAAIAELLGRSASSAAPAAAWGAPSPTPLPPAPSLAPPVLPVAPQAPGPTAPTLVPPAPRPPMGPRTKAVVAVAAVAAIVVVGALGYLLGSDDGTGDGAGTDGPGLSAVFVDDGRSMPPTATVDELRLNDAEAFCRHGEVVADLVATYDRLRSGPYADWHEQVQAQGATWRQALEALPPTAADVDIVNLTFQAEILTELLAGTPVHTSFEALEAAVIDQHRGGLEEPMGAAIARGCG